jgi:hypothetical protein
MEKCLTFVIRNLHKNFMTMTTVVSSAESRNKMKKYQELTKDETGTEHNEAKQKHSLRTDKLRSPAGRGHTKRGAMMKLTAHIREDFREHIREDISRNIRESSPWKCFAINNFRL